MTATLGDYFTLQRGTTYQGALLGQPGPVLLGLASIARNGGFKANNLKTYGGPSDDRMLLKPGDMYVSLKDVTQSADLLGAVARVPADVHLGRLTQDTVKLVFRKTDAPTKYLYWLLRTPDYREYCRAHATGTTNLGLSRHDFLSFPVPVLTEERRLIVELLQTLDDKMEMNRKTNETLEEMARSIFKDWFVDFGPTRAKAEGCPPYLAPDLWSLFPDRLNDADMPIGWQVEKLATIAVRNIGSLIKTGPFGSQLHQSDYVPSGIPVVMPTNLTFGSISEDGIARITSETAARLSEHKLLAGDIIYGRRGDIGRKAIVDLEQTGWLCGTGCLKLRILARECQPLFLFYFLDLPNIREWIAARAIGATMPNLNTSIIGEVEVLLPGEELCSAFCDSVTYFHQRLTASRLESKSLANLRDLLLPKLMSGEIRVRDAERALETAA